MNKYEKHDEAMLMAECHSPYQLARMYLDLQEEFSTNRVLVPQTPEAAKAMLQVSYNWLQSNAPDWLKDHNQNT